jgi:UDPglucose 6-dehydrogenase|tara:strand:- start:694 stop:1521 length:828 start_codon:yes stop_codon:yes gene_type:complete
MERYKVGIIGNGFVGEAQAFAYSPTADIKIYDIDPLKSTHTLEETCQSDFVFIAVPTPMNQDGSQNLSYIEDVFKKTTEGPIYIIKSTVLPGTTQKLIESFPKLNIIFSPEFLTERTAKLDMLTQARIILGGERNLCNDVKKLFNQRFMNRHYIITDPSTAEFIKYMNNTFFATKVSIINEFKRMSDALGTNWQDAIYGFSSDGRIGDSHLHVPGPDGKLGYGGTCFPKDVNALITMGSKLKTPMNTLEAGWKTNLEVRPESDWENLKGRAVSEK